VVGVLATTGTLQSAKFAALLDRFASDVQVITGLAQGWWSDRGRRPGQPGPAPVAGGLCAAVARGWLRHLILGCTHYPFLRPLLAEMVPADVAIIDTGAAVARQLQRLLADAACWPTARRSPLGSGAALIRIP
jgi:glutamate racemase